MCACVGKASENEDMKVTFCALPFFPQAGDLKHKQQVTLQPCQEALDAGTLYVAKNLDGQIGGAGHPLACP